MMNCCKAENTRMKCFTSSLLRGSAHTYLAAHVANFAVDKVDILAH
jgi:hypothetical protein